MDPSPVTPQTALALDRRFWLVLGSLALVWGSSFAANRAALSSLDATTALALRSLLSAVLMWSLVLWRGLTVPSRPTVWLGLAGIGCMATLAPNFLVLWGQQFVPSGLAGILNASTSLFTVAFASLLMRDERLTVHRAAGVICGFVGVAFALGAGNLSSFDATSLGQLAIILAAAVYASSGVLARRFVRDTSPEVVVAIYLTTTSLISLPLALSTKGIPSFDLGLRAWLGLGFLVVLVSVWSYLLVYANLRRYGASNLNLANLLTGPVAVILGAVLFGESLSPDSYFGFAMIGIGLVVIDGRILPQRMRR